MTLIEKVGQLFFPAAFINDSDENIQKLEDLIKNHHIGGLTFFHSRLSAATNFEGKKNIVRNDNSATRLKELIIHYQSIAKYPLLMSIDAEWGLVMRVEKTPQYPYAIALGALNDEENNLIFEVGQNTADDLIKVGIKYNLAPVIDINDNPKNPVIGYRSFGENREKVTKKALAFYNGMNKNGVLGCLKHFPGHGNTSVDSHLGLPIIEKTLAELHEQELYPFKEAIKQNIDSIMVGHLAVPALTNGKIVSATLSSEIIQGLLRNELGYKGAIISDALNMKSVSNLYDEKGLLEWKAFDAGNDILCFSENVAEGISKIVELASKERIDESFEQLLKLKNKVNLFDSDINLSEKLDFDFEKANQLNQKIANSSITINRNNRNKIPLNKNQKTAILYLYKEKENAFDKEISKNVDVETFEINENNLSDLISISDKLESFETIIIANFVPSIKPLNNFEINTEVLEFLATILPKENVIYCHFGNPYALDCIENTEKSKSLVIGYQHFVEFQIAVAKLLFSN